MLKKTGSTLSAVPSPPKVEIHLPQPEVIGFDFSNSDDRETVAKLLEAMGLSACYTMLKLQKIMDEKLENEDPADMKISELGKAIQAVGVAATQHFEKAGLIRQGVESIGGKEVSPDEIKSPEYVRALRAAADVIEQAS